MKSFFIQPYQWKIFSLTTNLMCLQTQPKQTRQLSSCPGSFCFSSPQRKPPKTENFYCLISNECKAVVKLGKRGLQRLHITGREKMKSFALAWKEVRDLRVFVGLPSLWYHTSILLVKVPNEALLQVTVSLYNLLRIQLECLACERWRHAIQSIHSIM